MQAIHQGNQKGAERQMGWRVRENISEPEAILDVTSTTIQAGSWGEPVHLSGGIRGSSQLCLIWEELGAQLPVFNTSKSLFDAERRYPKIGKLILELVVTAWKLRPYFQGHPVIILTQYPLRLVLHSLDLSQWVMKWALELVQRSLAYQPRRL